MSPVPGERGRSPRQAPAMGPLERWDRHNQGWAAASIRDPDRRTGVGVIAVVGVLWAVATGVAVVLGEWLVAAVAAVKAQIFLLVALFVWGQARRRRSGRAGARRQ